MLADKMSIIEALGILLDLAEDNILQKDQTDGCPELKEQRKLQITALNIVDTLRENMKKKNLHMENQNYMKDILKDFNVKLVGII